MDGPVGPVIEDPVAPVGPATEEAAPVGPVIEVVGPVAQVRSPRKKVSVLAVPDPRRAVSNTPEVNWEASWVSNCWTMDSANAVTATHDVTIVTANHMLDMLFYFITFLFDLGGRKSFMRVLKRSADLDVKGEAF